jgi:hypothetical protein
MALICLGGTSNRYTPFSVAVSVIVVRAGNQAPGSVRHQLQLPIMDSMRRPCWPAAGIVLLFLLMGLAFLEEAGMHYDASYELACFYTCSTPAFKTTLFHHRVPVMIIQYLGALKAWLYLPILKFLDVTPLSLRLPFVFAGAGSVWLFFSMLNRVSGRRAAIAGTLLLATDASFLLATTYDFGPIALLHLALLGGIVLLFRFEATRKAIYLAAAFFVFGLASAAVIPKRILALVTPARLAVAALSFCLGALPLIYYNVVTKGATFHTGNVMAEAAPLAQKVLLFRKTMNGSVMFGWLTEDLKPETARAPDGPADKISMKAARATGRRTDWMLYAFLASCCLLPWLWFTPARQPALFAAIYLAVVWGQMAIVPNTGATLHHVILLWPFPHFLIAVAGVQLADRYGRYAMAAALVAVVGCNLLVINNYHADLVTRGTTVIWTDAINPLFEYLDSLGSQQIVAVDWGYGTTLCLLSDGQMPLHDISFALLNPSPGETTFIRSLIAKPDTVFVDHMPDGEQFPAAHENLERIAAGAGYTKEVVDVITDRNQRPRFEISHFRETHPQQTISTSR